MTFSVAIKELVFSDGSITHPPVVGVTVLVGPNNSGKSATLRELLQSLSHQQPYPPIPLRTLQHIVLQRNGDYNALKGWLDENATYVDDGYGNAGYQRIGASRIALRELTTAWEASGSGLGQLHAFLIWYANAESRLQLVGEQQQPNIDINYNPSHPLHYVYMSGALEQRISSMAEENFGDRLTMLRLGSQIGFRVGVPDVEPPRVNELNPEYVEALNKLPPLSQQGDGMRSFLGLYMALLVRSYSIVLIDEPDAFLHPPQSRSLGRELAALAMAGNLQVMVATHDSDLLRGLLEVPQAAVAVIRLTRRGDMNSAFQLHPAPLRDLWQDPLLRYGNALDGLFHKLVVVCEGDVDCRFYAITLDELTEEQRGGLHPSDVLFVPAGGKNRLHLVVAAMRAAGVPVRVAADFDVLDNGETLKRLVEAAGGVWETLKELWSALNSPLIASGRSPRRQFVRQEIGEILGRSKSEALSTEDIADLKQLLREERGWNLAKTAGLAAVPHGAARAAAQGLLQNLRAMGIHLLPGGELEGLVPSVGGKSTSWLASVLADELHKSATEAKVFVEALVAAGSPPVDDE